MNKTLVAQSYRTHDVPAWIATCLDSVRAWARQQHYSYHFVGDKFFSYAPDWVITRCASQIFPVTDITRLYLLKEMRAAGADRVIWADADVLVFDPANFLVETRSGYAFSHEVMIVVLPDQRIHVSKPSINNSVMVFERETPMLDFYLLASEEILRHLPAGEVPRTIIGPAFLMNLANAMPVERLSNVGLRGSTVRPQKSRFFA